MFDYGVSRRFEFTDAERECRTPSEGEGDQKATTGVAELTRRRC